MSKDVAQLVYSRKTGSSVRKAVLASMAERANDDGTGVWISKVRIARETEFSRKAVIEAIKAMVADGLLIDNGLRKSGSTVDYTICVKAVERLPFTDPEKEKQRRACADQRTPDPVYMETLPLTTYTQGVSPQVTVGVNEGDRGCHPCSHEPSLNRPLSSDADASESARPRRKANAQIGKGKARRQARATSIPENWQPGPIGLAYASSKGLTPQEIEHECEKFRAYYGARRGKRGGRFTDWHKVWTGWVLRAIDYGNVAAHRKQPARNADGADSFLAALDRAANGDAPRTPSRRDGEELESSGYVIKGECHYRGSTPLFERTDGLHAASQPRTDRLHAQTAHGPLPNYETRR